MCYLIWPGVNLMSISGILTNFPVLSLGCSWIVFFLGFRYRRFRVGPRSNDESAEAFISLLTPFLGYRIAAFWICSESFNLENILRSLAAVSFNFFSAFNKNSLSSFYFKLLKLWNCLFLPMIEATFFNISCCIACLSISGYGFCLRSLDWTGSMLFGVFFTAELLCCIDILHDS
jgi:hypothetical protein